MEIELIRHFATEGNLEKRYIGVTDEEIKAEFVLEHSRLSVSRCGNVILAFLRGRIIRS